MNYMPILPIGMFDLYIKANIENVFILPQYWEIDDYCNFYRAYRWGTVIIDNAMYEQPDAITFGKLIEIAESINSTATYIVTPEDLHNGAETVRKTRETIKVYGCGGDTWYPMAILHGNPKSISDQVKALNPIQTMAYGIAVSSWRAGYDRSALRKICNIPKYRYVHAMGLDSLVELVNLSDNYIDSVDSSIVASAAVNKINLREELILTRKGLPTDPIRVDLLQRKFPDVTIQSTLNNILLIESILNGQHVW